MERIKMMTTEKIEKAAVLVVDDESVNLQVLFDYLREAGLRVLVAEKGEEALSCVKLTLPDIILLDIMMSDMDGFETCRLFKENKVTKDIPIIFMTALSDTVNKIRGFELGAVDYVTKPFHQEEVLARIKTHLTIQRQKKELKEAAHKIRTLSGLLPICANCKKIRDDNGYWEQIEVYIRDHSDANFSHSICPECIKKLYPEYYEELNK
ncbi:response regulator [Desulfobacterales bacterium HSG2]|nr:response regulator [Desulfobacterales bacterium HSG2]